MPSHIQYAPECDWFSKTDEFRYLAEHFEEHKCYTFIPAGTIEYKKFWEDIREKCIDGYTNSVGIKITGQHFFYLNFVQILMYDEKTGKKSMGFPKFVDVDYDWFWIVDYSKRHQKNVVCVKGRRQGYSYKAAAIMTHEYTFFADSRSIVGAFLAQYSEGTMQFALDNCNFLNNYTEFRKQRNPDTSTYIMARYKANIGGVDVYKGSKSSIECLTFKDKPGAAVGKTATWLVLDEAGLFPNIIEAYGYSEPLIRDGNIYTGCALIFGSAGSMEAGTQFLYEIFTNPTKYNCLDFVDPENEEKKIGYLSSATRGRWGLCANPSSAYYQKPMVDSNGNSIEEAAYDDIIFEREQARGSLNPARLHKTITQYPLTYREAFLRTKGNIFASTEMNEWLAKLEVTPSLRDEGQKGELIFDINGKLKWYPSPDLHYITDFPLRSEDRKDGCIMIWEHPDYSDPNQIPNQLYISGCDPYDQDKSETGSLGSFFIYKRFYRADKTHDIIVAEYSGRPEFADMFYENCRKLCIYYNAKCLYENQLKGLKTYFEQKNCLHYLYEQPQIIKDIVKDSKVSRGYGIHMNRGTNGASGIKDQCELYLRKWLYEEREINGVKMLNLYTIKSIPLLKELINYDREGNYDRVIALMLCILQTHELHKIIVDSEFNKPLFDVDPFFKKPLFAKNTYGKVRY
jgi:hypothetical protein